MTSKMIHKLVQAGYAVLFFSEGGRDFVSVSRGEKVEITELTENSPVFYTILETAERLEGKPMPEFHV